MKYYREEYIMGKTHVSYVPHGINAEIFKPIDQNQKQYIQFKSRILKGKQYSFILFYNNRNIRRKCTSNLMVAFKMFVNSLPQNERSKTLLLLHTAPSDMAGTDLTQVHSKLMPQCNIIIIPDGYSPQQMNYLYNMVDVTAGVSSAQGYGLATAQSILAGTPIIATVTGGLQDQMRITKNNSIYFNDIKQPSAQDGKIEGHGSWVYPLIPQLSVQGSPPTPYIYDSRPRIKDIAIAINY